MSFYLKNARVNFQNNLRNLTFEDKSSEKVKCLLPSKGKIKSLNFA